MSQINEISETISEILGRLEKEKSPAQWLQQGSKHSLDSLIKEKDLDETQ